MRVITGTARGMKLNAPYGLDVRPTSDMAKEAIFSILQNEIENARVLDLFAGSGQLGIEAISRGASQATFIDSSKAALDCVRENLKHTRLEDKAQVISMDSLSFLEGTRNTFDIVFIDPPYKKGIVEKALPLVTKVMNENGIILCETEKTEDLPEEVGDFIIARRYKYGKAKITLYRRSADMEKE